MTMRELTVDDLRSIVEAAVESGIAKCPTGHVIGDRVREIECWKAGHQALMNERGNTRIGLWWPLLVLVIGQIITTAILYHILPGK